METKTVSGNFVMKTRYGWQTKDDFIKACKFEIKMAGLLEAALKATLPLLEEMDGKVINKSIAPKAQKMLDDKGIEVKVEYTNEYNQLRFTPNNPYSDEKMSNGYSYYSSEQVAAVRLQWHGNKRLSPLESAGEWNKAMEWREHIIRQNNEAAVNYDRYALMNKEITEAIEKYQGECSPLLRMNITKEHFGTGGMYE